MNATSVTQEFGATQVCKLIGLPYQTLNNWVKTGFIIPSIARPAGRGKPSKFSFCDLVAIKTASSLRKAGISLQGIRKATKYIQNHLQIDNPLVERWLATDGKEVYMVDGNALLALLRHPGQKTLFYVVDVTYTAQELQEKVTILNTPHEVSSQGAGDDVRNSDSQKETTGCLASQDIQQKAS